MPMRILVTGAAGFGASGLIRELLTRGENITGLDVVGKNQVRTLADEDLRKIGWEWKGVHDLQPDDLNEFDVLVHLAAQADVEMGIRSPQFTVWQNVCGSLALLEAVRRCKTIPRKILYAGSGNEYGRPLYLPIDEEHPLTPHNPYAFSKAAAEMAFWTYQRCYGLPVTVLTNGVVVGPGMRREIFVFRWFKNILLKEAVALEGGDQTRDITYVTDVVEGWLRVIYASDADVNGQKFQLSYGEEHSVEEILEWCFEIAGRRVPVVTVPHRPGEKGQRELFTNHKARTVLGFAPKVPPYEALRKTWEWIQTLE